MKYGVFIGRFQPFHLGHQAVVNEILLDGLIPVLVLGSSGNNRDMDKNPLRFSKRTTLIDIIYPNTFIKYIYSQDNKDWSVWYNQLITNLKTELNSENLTEDVVFYYNNKEVDKTSFSVNGKEYLNTWYTDLFKDAGFKTQHIKFADRLDIKVEANARDIRHDLEGNKHLLDARVYRQLKEWDWK